MEWKVCMFTVWVSTFGTSNGKLSKDITNKSTERKQCQKDVAD